MQESSMSQEELARKIGMGQATVSRVLACKTAMSVDQFSALCKVLKLDPVAVIAEALR